MIYVSEELKQAFLSAEQKNLLLTFDDGTVIDNDDIALESMGLEQTLCDSDELKFGKIASACFKTKIKASTKIYKNLWFNASIGVGEHAIPLGRFRVYTDNMTSDRLYRNIVAYDTLFWAINTDVTEWYNGLTFPVTQKAFRDSLFEHLGIEQEVVELPNDSITFNRTVNAENLTGLTVLQKLCELNATWGTINNVGKFKYVRVRTHEHDALYPSDDLFPSDNLFPDDIYDDRLPKASYYQGTLKYEEYDTQPISKVTIREDADDLGYSYGEDGNTYVIEDNFLLYGASDSTLQTVAKNFFDYAQYIAYTPSQLKCKGAPWREVGDLLLVVADKRTLTIPILNRQLSGITALKDTYIAKGKETYGEVKNSTAEQLKQLQSRTNKLTRTLDETRSEITKVETSIKTDGRNYVLHSEKEAMGVISVLYHLSEFRKQMNGQNTVLSFDARGKNLSEIVIEIGSTEVARIDATSLLLNEFIRFTVVLPVIEDFSNILTIRGGYFPTTQFHTQKVKLEIGEVSTDWTPAPEDLPGKFSEYSTTTEMRSEIKQTADEINLEVSKKVGDDEVISKINQSAEEISIEAQKINFNGMVTANENFKILEDGSMEAVGGKFSGDITGGSINIVGKTTSDNPYFKLQSPTNENKYVNISHDGIVVVDYMDISSENPSSTAIVRTSSDDGSAEMRGGKVTALSMEAYAFVDRSLVSEKKNFEPFNNALDVLKSIDIYKYNYKKEADTKKKHIGLVIGDEYNYSKEVTNDENTCVDLYSFIGVCAKAINELVQIVDEQNNRIKELEERLGV